MELYTYDDVISNLVAFWIVCIYAIGRKNIKWPHRDTCAKSHLCMGFLSVISFCYIANGNFRFIPLFVDVIIFRLLLVIIPESETVLCAKAAVDVE